MSTRQSIHSIHNKKFWTEFFYLYESLPALWNMNNPLYKNRQVKCDAYDIMVDKLREMEPNADREDVLRKINIFRTNYRRECSRINISLQEGRHYQSTLWYFDLLSFLQTADTRRERKRNFDEGGEKSIMRKRRINNMIPKTSDQLIITVKKEHLIKYSPRSTQEFECDVEEDADFDYAPDKLTQSFVDGKMDSNPELQHTTLLSINNYHHQTVEVNEGDDDQSQQEYERHQNEFQNYTAQRAILINNPKMELITNNGTQITDEINTVEIPIEINDESQEQQVFHDYTGENESLETSAQWCIRKTNSQNESTQQPKNSGYNTNDNITLSETKFLRDVKTMTTHNNKHCCSLLSEGSEILAKSWAVQYDELSVGQKLLARKAINDILFEGCMGQLVIGSDGRVTNEGYKNINSKNLTENKEVESSEVYKQPS